MMQKTTVMPKNKQPKMKAAKKKEKQPRRSHVYKGQVFIQRPVFYHEITKESIGTIHGTNIGD